MLHTAKSLIPKVMEALTRAELQNFMFLVSVSRDVLKLHHSSWNIA